MRTVQITTACTKGEREVGHTSINTTDNGKEIFQSDFVNRNICIKNEPFK